MKKRLAILALVSVMTAGLTSCGEGYDYKDGVMLTINGKEYTTTDLYTESFGYDTSTGVNAYYKILNNVAIEAAVSKDDSMKREVAEAIQSFKDTAADSAKNNGTTESEEIEKALDSAGVDSLEQLENKYYLEKKTKKASDDYISDSRYTDKYIPDYTSSDHPYHVRHILVKYDSDSTASLNQGTISQSDAEDISNVASRLANGETFSSVAQQKSEDGESSANNKPGVSGPSVYGDCGIMSTKTGFVNEFKYGIYTYDAFFNPNVSAENKATIKKSITDGGCFSSEADVNSEYATVAGQNVYGIPYSEVKKLGAYATKTLDKNGQSVTNAPSYYYPRNVIFNNYFNNHGLSFIYLDDYDASMATTAYGDECYTNTEYTKLNNGTSFRVVSGISDKLVNYGEDNATKHTTKVNSVSTSKKILCDEKGNPILVTRASSGSGDSGYSGLHFIVLQYDPFNTVNTTEVAVNDYYTLTKPSTTTDDATAKPSYVGFIKTTDRTIYTYRAAAVKTAADEHDSNVEYTKYEYYMGMAKSGNNKNKVTITVNPEIDTAVTNYIAASRASSEESTLRTYNTSWQTFLYSLKNRDTYADRILPESAITAFANGAEGTDGYTAYEAARAK